MTPRFATAAIFFVNGVVIGTWAAHIPFVKEHYGISKSAIGLCLLAIAAGALIAMPIAGQLLDRRSSAAMTRFAAVLEPAIFAFVLLAPSPWALAAVLLVFGAANGLLDVTMNAHGIAIERRGARPIMSSLHAGWSLGALTGATGAALGNAAGLDPRLEAGIVAVLGLAIAAAAAPRLGPAGTATSEPGAARAGLALPARGALLLGVLAAVLMLAEGGVGDWSALYLKEDLGAAPSLAAVGFAAFAGGMALGRVFGDRLNLRLGAGLLLRGGCGLAAAALGAALLSGTPVVAIPAFALVGLGIANTVPLLYSAAGRVPGMPPGPAIAAVTTTGYFGLLAGPPVLGFFADATSLPASLALVAALIAASALLAGRAAGGAALRGHGAAAEARA